MTIKTVRCSMCREGHVMSPHGPILSCSVCQGTGYVTPGTICANCGRSCTKVTDGHPFCGDAKCLESAKKSYVPNPQFWRGHIMEGDY